MGWIYKDIADSFEPLDRLWFDTNPDRLYLARRPQYADEMLSVENHWGSVVVLMRCRGHGTLHRTVYMFPGRCEILNLNSDDAVCTGVQLIMADPDGPGN